MASDPNADSYPEIGGNDRTNLLGSDDDSASRSKCRRFCVSHKWCFIISSVLLLAAIGHAIAIYFIYFRCNLYMGNCAVLKVMALNTWGMPATFGSQDKTERMKAIAKEISKGDYDLYLLSELWMQADHEEIEAKIPEGYKMTGFRELALSTCDGRVAPTACSGLAIVSRLPIKSHEFHSYTYHGDPLKAWIDGEWLARKGVGLVRIEPLANVTMDVFITHTAADPDKSHNYTNEYYRIRQVKELMKTYEQKASGDIVLLGGDFNAPPINKPGNDYYVIRQKMKNCIEELFYKLQAWLNPKYATYGNPQNTFTGEVYDPVIYDYVFYQVNAPRLTVWTSLFELPLFKTLLHLPDKKDKEISFSDHEAITTTIYIWK